MKKKAIPVEHICGNENCCAVFYGRANAVYCTRRCREAATKRRHRARPKPTIHLAERMGYSPRGSRRRFVVRAAWPRSFRVHRNGLMFELPANASAWAPW